MAKTAEHSKLPWYVSNIMAHIYVINDPEEINQSVINSAVAHLSYGQGQVDAEFIIRCVNSHDKLVEACKIGLSMFSLHTGKHPNDDLANVHMDYIRQAIKEAEGE